MKKYILFFILCISLSDHITAQEDRFRQLNEKNIIGFTKPLATTLGSGINSAEFYSAYIPKSFGFSISLRAMLISIPNKQLTFTPELPEGYIIDEPSPTFWGAKGGVSYLGTDGYISMPGGIDEKLIPLVMPQITAGFMGTEVLLRFIPKIKTGQEELSLWGVGISHSISQYIPSIPLSIAIQAMYNKLKLSDIVDGTNFAVNAHVSKSFGLFTTYSGLQYESSKFNLNYTLKGDINSGDLSLRIDRKISAEVKGDNNFRFILGGALNLSVIVINADVNLGSQIVITSGLSFVF
jgi:hypothetical protein